MNIITAAIFDVDGLMLDTERIAKSAWQKALAEWDLTISDELYRNLVGRNIHDVKLLLRDHFGDGFPLDRAYEKKHHHMQQHISNYGILIKPGLIDLLDFLKSAGVKMAVASSSPSNFVNEKLTSVGIRSRFKTIVCGDQIRHGKPAPDIFLEVARELGAQPSQCVVLEDSEAGIRGASAAGMLPIMIPDMKEPSPEVANLAFRVLHSLHDAKSIFINLLA
jgi:HAD superfamily hydrolase (TIGR01509 family)